MDKIVFKTEKDLMRMFEWKDNNKELVRDLNLALNEGIIIYKDAIEITFKRNDVDECINITVEASKKRIMTFELVHMSNLADTNVLVRSRRWYPNDIFSINEHNEGLTQDVITLFMSCMAYMVNHIEYVDKRSAKVLKEMKNKKKSKKSKGKSRKRFVKMGRVIYTISVPQEKGAIVKDSNKDGSGDGKDFTFNVRGHWRHFKDGKRVWVNSYTKGKGELREKVYRP